MSSALSTEPQLASIGNGSIQSETAALLEQRYGAPFELEEELRRVPAVASLLSHHSVRRYSGQPLAAGTLELLVAAAQSASSSSNLQLWSVISVEDPERRRALSEVAGQQDHILRCPLFLVWIADLHRPTQLAQARGIGHAGLSYLEMFVMACIDAALAAQNAVVAAEALGLGIVYIGALRNDPERVARALDLPTRTFAVFGLCVGWPDLEAASAIKPRLPQSVVLHRDSYGNAAQKEAAVDTYDERMTRFYSEQGMQVPDGRWSLHSAKRIASVAALRGRDRLRSALRALGFELL
jgi:nitroreductase